MQFLIIKNFEDRIRALKAISELDLKKSFSVEIKRYRKNRSLAQNRLMWKWINEIADHTGYNPDEAVQAVCSVTPDEVHEMLKKRLLGTIQREIFGDTYDVTRSTTTLTTLEFSEYLSRIEAAANLLQIPLTKPDDYKYAMMGE